MFDRSLPRALRCLSWSLAVVLGLALALAAPPRAQARETVSLFEPDIIGGKAAEPGEWPHQVAILDAETAENLDAQYCGGTLIDPEWVLTAAHCVEGFGALGETDVATIELGLGMHDLEAGDGRRVAAAQIIIHPDYYDSGLETGDIALVRLAERVAPSARELPIGLVEDAADAALQTGRPAWVTGWGMVDDGSYATVLHEVEVPVVSEALCRIDPDATLDGESLCAGALGKDSCYGDSGGPLVVGAAGSWRLAGLVSAGTTDICGGEDNYTLYTSVPFYLDWIRATLADRGPDLELGVAAPESIRPAERFQYTVAVRNTGREPAAGLTVSDVLPPGLRFVAASDAGSLARGAVRWQLGTLAPGQGREMSITVDEDPSKPGSPLAAEPAAADGEDWEDGDGEDGGGREDDGPGGDGPGGDGPGGDGPGGDRPGRPAAPLVVGGRDAARQAWPWQVALFASPVDVATGHFCGGTVIDASWILTAAHCVYDEGLLPPDLIGVMAGSNSLADERDQVLAEIDQIFLNARYLLDDNADLALLRLKEPLPAQPAILPVPLAGAADAALRAPGKEAVVTGWGATDAFGDVSPDLLQEARLPISGAGRCAEEVDPAQQLCAGKPEGGASACFGDSGGPLVVQQADGAWVQVGITSAVTDDYCGIPGSLSLFTRVDAFAPWIALKRATGKADKVLLNTELKADATGMDEVIWSGEALTLVDPLAAPATPGSSASSTPAVGPSATVPTTPSGTPSDKPPRTPSPAATSVPTTYLPLLRRP